MTSSSNLQSNSLDSFKVSIFDDESTDKSFQFIVPGSSHSFDLSLPPLHVVSMTVRDQSSHEEISGLFGLQGSIIVRYENKVNKSLLKIFEVKRAKLSSLGFTVFLTKNQKTFELTFPNEEIKEKWIEYLRKVCIMTDFESKYAKIKVIKSDSTQKIYLVQEKRTEKAYLTKTYWRNLVEQDGKVAFKQGIHNEIDLLQKLSHQNLVQLYEIHEVGNFIHLVMYPVQGISLEKIISRPTFKDEFSQDQMMHIIYSILDCTAYMASKGTMHRGLNTRSILIEKDGKVKLIDLGLATQINLPKYIFSKCGIPGYVAPEVLKYSDAIASTRYNDRCDVFSIGCIFFYMIFGRPLFKEKGQSETIDFNDLMERLESETEKISNGIKKTQNDEKKQGLKLLLLLLEPNHKKRISAKDALNHEYFALFKTKQVKFGSSKNSLFDDQTASSQIEYSFTNTISLKIQANNMEASSDRKDKYNSMNVQYEHTEQSKKVDPSHISLPTVTESEGLTKSQFDSEPTFSNFSVGGHRTSIMKNEHSSIRSSIFRAMKPQMTSEEPIRRNSAQPSPKIILKPISVESSSNRRYSEHIQAKHFDFASEEKDKSAPMITTEESEVHDEVADDNPCQLKVFIERVKTMSVKQPSVRAFRL